MKQLLVIALATSAGFACAQEISTEAWYAVPDARGVQRVNIECGADFIDPREIVVEAGVPVELSVRSAEASQEFVSGLAANTPLAAQASKHAFVAAMPGRHPMLCKTRGTGDEQASPRRRGILHVGPPKGRP
jgi:hypothetical protein